jgi:hypothetical protein
VASGPPCRTSQLGLLQRLSRPSCRTASILASNARPAAQAQGVQIRTISVVFLSWLASCGGPDLYASCDTSEDCTDLSETAEGVCLQFSDEEICTWTCATDADCESDEDYPRVCAPFQEGLDTWCFPSCEDADVSDPEKPCPEGYTCRSTGGGAENRKFCAPGE